MTLAACSGYRFGMRFITFFACGLLAMPFAALALEGDVRRIPDNISYADLNGDKQDEFIMRTKAPAPDGSQVLIMSVFRRDEANQWVPIAFKKEGGTMENAIQLIENADCALNEIYYYTQESSTERKILLARRTKDVQAEETAPQSPVRFEYYALVQDDNPIPGQPSHYFKFERAEVSEEAYCNAADAVEK